MEKSLPPPPRSTETDEQLTRWLNQIPDLLPRINVYSFLFDPANVNANAHSVQSFTASGLVSADLVYLNVSLTSGLIVANPYVVADDRLEMVLYNTTGSGIDQASTTFWVVALR